jgi:recombination protein RecR
MAAVDFPPSVQRLIALLKGMPGIGPRGAERLALWLLKQGQARRMPLADTLARLDEQVILCDACGFYLERGEPCALCEGKDRDRSVLCVVEEAPDVLRLERSGGYRGLYHVLGGRLSPLDNITPAELRVGELLERLKTLETREVILALGADVEGEATAAYLADLLRGSGIEVTRLAQGMPAGGGLDHVDEITIQRALLGRRLFSAGS